VADGVAVDAQPLRHILAGLGVTAGQSREHLEPWPLAAIMGARQALLRVLHIFSHDR
jgi:hypothetical protein